MHEIFISIFVSGMYLFLLTIAETLDKVVDRLDDIAGSLARIEVMEDDKAMKKCCSAKEVEE